MAQIGKPRRIIETHPVKAPEPKRKEPTPAPTKKPDKEKEKQPA